MKYLPEMPRPNGYSVTEEGAKLGRFLFYDPILSSDSSMSCSSCHKQQKAFSDAPNRFSEGVSGIQLNRNTPALFNLAWYPSFFWDGRANNLQEQVFEAVSAHDELNLNWREAVKRIKNSRFYQSKFKKVYGKSKIDSQLIAQAIAQFERTLISNNSKYDKVLREEATFTIKEYKGLILMNDQTKGDCLHCHTTDANALGTTAKFSNNGLQKADAPEDYTDKGKAAVTGKKEHLGEFKIPSLRNIAITAPYMHDGRFKTLKEVLDFYSEGVHNSYNIDTKMEYAYKGGVHLTEKEKGQIIAFLHTLTDSTFLKNEAFRNPFK